MTDRREGRHPPEEALHRFAEGGGQGNVEEHLRGCAVCRREVVEIRELRARAEALPREIPPETDLWPAIEARLRERQGAAGPEGGAGGGRGLRLGDRRLRAAAPWLAAAAAVLVAVTAGATLWLADGPEERTASANAPAATSPSATGTVRPVGLAELESSYRPVVERLTAVLEAREGRLPPETRAALERNLRIVDAAIAEAESALVGGPPTDERLRALDRSYRRKVETLRRSVRLTAQM